MRWEVDKVGIDKVHFKKKTTEKCDYFENTWLDGGQFSPTMCSVFEQDRNRTNDHLEGWHWKFSAGIS